MMAWMRYPPTFKTQISVKNRFPVFHLILNQIDSIHLFDENFKYSINISRKVVFSFPYDVSQRIKVTYLEKIHFVLYSTKRSIVRTIFYRRFISEVLQKIDLIRYMPTGDQRRGADCVRR